MPPRNVVVAGGLALFAVAMAAFPALAVRRQQSSGAPKNRMMKEGALNDTQMMRGNYMNSGGRDVGRDPDWDFKEGKYKGRSAAGHSVR